MSKASGQMLLAMAELLRVVADEAERTGAGYGGLHHLSFNKFADNLRVRARSIRSLATKDSADGQ